MVCTAEQNNLRKPARGNSGTSPNCGATLAGFFIGDKMVQIPLTKGKVAIVDDDWWWLDVWKWHISKTGRTYYAAHHVEDKKTSKVTRFYMHRLIIGAEPSQKVDHINGDGLDNRRCNLRFCTNSQNFQNAKKRSGCTSKYKGVYWDKNAQKWRTQICPPDNKGNTRHIGCFDDEVVAAKAYDRAAIELFGEFARPNFPQKMLIDGG